MWLKDISGEGRAYGFFFMPLAFWTVFVIACLIAALLHRTASAFRPK
jgi:ribose/xylose/arabinose/galactoside ABC-type transport system permease subunit